MMLRDWNLMREKSKLLNPFVPEKLWGILKLKSSGHSPAFVSDSAQSIKRLLGEKGGEGFQL